METILMFIMVIFMIILIAILGIILALVMKISSTFDKLRNNPIFMIPAAVMSVIDDYKRKKVGKKW